MTFGDALWSQEGMGIYVFYDKDYAPLYIGKVGSRSFLERISGHLDTHIHKGGSHTGWFNTFQKRWVSYFGEDDVEAMDFSVGSFKRSFEKFRILALPFSVVTAFSFLSCLCVRCDASSLARYII